MKRSSSRKLKYGLAGIFLVASILFLPHGYRWLFGQGPDTIIIGISIGPEAESQLASLEAALEDETTFEALKRRLAFGLIWHVSSQDTEDGYKHIFHFGGRRRNSTRLLGFTVRTVRSGEGYRVDGFGQEFGYQPLGITPAIRNIGELEVLRAALQDAVVGDILVDSIETREANYRFVSVQTLTTETYHLYFRGLGRNSESIVHRWVVRKDGMTNYTFVAE